MNVSEVWKPLDLDAVDAALPALPRSALHVVVILASPGAREGGWAGRAALEMCRAWGADGAQVLLVDTSFEAPELHEPAGLDNLEGISDALLFGTSFQRLGQPLSEGLILATAGTAVPKGEALRAHPRWREFAAGFSEAGAMLALYLPSDAPGADALIPLADVAVALVRADEAEAMELPGDLLLLAAAGPEGPSSEAAAPDVEQVEAEHVGTQHVGTEHVEAEDAEAGAFMEVEPELAPPADDFVPSDEFAAAEDLVADDLFPTEDFVSTGDPTPSDSEVLGDPFAEVSLDAEAPGETEPVPGEPETGEETPTLDEILAETGSAFAGETDATTDEGEPTDLTDPLGAGAGFDPLAPGDSEASGVGDLGDLAAVPETAEDAELVPSGAEADVAIPTDGGWGEEDALGDETPVGGIAGNELSSADPADGIPAVAAAGPGPGRKVARSGPSPVLLFLLLIVVVGALVAGWLGIIEIPGLTPAGGGVEEAGAAEVTRPLDVDPASPASALGEGAAAPAAEAANPLAAWVLAVGSFAELETARSRARTYGTALPEVQFIVAPVEVEGVPYFRLLAGPAADVSTLEAIQSEVARVLPGESEWILREAGYAYLISTAGRLALAERQVEVLERTGIPAHVLQYDDGGGSPSWRVYSGAYASEAEAAYLRELLARNGIEDVPLVERRGVLPE